MFKREFGALGEMAFEYPKSACMIWDIFFMVANTPNRAQLGRLFAALVGITIQDKTVPKYNISDCDPLAYGGKVQEWLISKHISPIVVLDVGTQILTHIQENFVTQKDVEQATNFT